MSFVKINNIKQAVILCGGFGTRLRNQTKDKIPKTLIKVNNIPFIIYLLNQIIDLGFSKIIFCTGFLGDQVEREVLLFKKKNNLNLQFIFSCEKVPLGTAGSIVLAKKHLSGEDALILNGDTYFNGSISNFIKFHYNNNSQISISANIKFLSSRYGKLITYNNQLIDIIEKKFTFYSYVYSGIFILNSNILKNYNNNIFMNVEDSFFKNKSFKIYVWKNNSTFIDIGTEYSFKKSSSFMSKIKLKYLIN